MDKDRTRSRRQDLVSVYCQPIDSSKARRGKKKLTMKKDRWVCDICQVAKFERYVDAFRHEKQCLENQSEKEQKLSQVENDRHSRPAEVLALRTDQRRPKSKSQQDVKWLCGVCEVACFDDYEKAFRHEKLCSSRQGGLETRDPFTSLPVLTSRYLDNI